MSAPLPVNETSFPDPPPGMIWHQFPPDALYLSDSKWYDTLGQDAIDQGRIFSLTPTDQVIKIKALLKDHPTRGLDILFKASAKGKIELVRALLDLGVNAVAGEGQMESLVPLHAACFQGRLECAKLLVERGGVGVDAKDDLGGTPLMRAATGGRVEVVEWLLSQGADVAIRQHEGDVDALEFGAGGGNVEVVRAIWERGVGKVRVTTKALEAGAGSGNEDVVRFLLEVGGYADDLGAEAVEGGERGDVGWKVNRLTGVQREATRDAVPRAAQSGSIAIVKLLLEYLTPLPIHLALDQKTRHVLASGVLSAAASETDFAAEIVELLLDTIFSSTTSGGSTSGSLDEADDAPELNVERTTIINEALVHSAGEDSIKTVRLLLDKYGAAVDYHQPPQNASALYRAAGLGHVRLVHMLVREYNADIHAGNGRFSNGPTALWIAVSNQQVDVVKVLLEAGGPVESVDEGLDERTTVVWVCIWKDYRAPVRMKKERIEGEDAQCLRLEYEGKSPWFKVIQRRREDNELRREGVEIRMPF